MKAQGCLPPAALEELAGLEAEHRRAQDTLTLSRKAEQMQAVMAELREFGRWPEQHAPSKDPKREAERLLAQRFAKMKAAASLPAAVVEELDALEAAHRQSQETLEAERRDSEMENIITQVMDLGRWPLLRRPP